MLEELSVACSADCIGTTLPTLPTECNPEVWGGRVNEIIFVPCAEEIDDAWALDLANWTRLFTGTGTGRKSGKGIGSYQFSAGTPIDTGANCGVPTMVGVKMTWELLFRSVIIDKDEEFKTHEFASKLQAGALNQYKLFARFCDAPDTILPIGKVALSQYNNILPEGTEEFMTINYGFQWKQRGVPTPIVVAGIDAILK